MKLTIINGILIFSIILICSSKDHWKCIDDGSIFCAQTHTCCPTMKHTSGYGCYEIINGKCCYDPYPGVCGSFFECQMTLPSICFSGLLSGRKEPKIVYSIDPFNKNIDAMSNSCMNNLKQKELAIIFKNKIYSSSIIYNPDNWNDYCYDIKSNGNIEIHCFNIDQYENKMRELTLNDNIRNKLKLIIYTSDIVIDSFEFEIENSLGYLELISGIISRSNNEINLVYVRSFTSTKLKTFHNTVRVRDCDTFMFFKKCEWVDKFIPRGYTGDELSIIEQILKYNSFIFIKEKLKFIDSQTLVYLEKTNKNFYRNDMTKFKKELENLRGVENISQIFKNDETINKIKNEIQIIKHNNLDQKNIETIIKGLNLNEYLDNYLLEILFKYIKEELDYISNNHNSVIRIFSSFNKISLIELYFRANKYEYDFEYRLVHSEDTPLDIINLISIKKNMEKLYKFPEFVYEKENEINALIGLLELLSSIIK